ncbi:MAG: DNA-binding response regulator [Nevskia sp.]|nr:DNA-binding response regulator [Nevskia sp.]
MNSRSTQQALTQSRAGLRATARASFVRWIDGVIQRLETFTATPPWAQPPRGGCAESAITMPGFADGFLARLSGRGEAATEQPRARTGRHLRMTLAVADADDEFLRVMQRACGGRRLIRYAAGAPLLAEAKAARSVSGTAPWDAALITLGLPDLNGTTAIAQMRALHPGLCIWATVGVEESHTLIGAICAGADGYIVKNFAPGSAAMDLGALDQDQRPLGRKLAVSLLQLAGDSLWSREPSIQSLPPLADGFTRTQLQLLRLIARGDSIAVAGERMSLVEGDANMLVRQIYAVLQSPQRRDRVPEALREQVRARMAGGREDIEIR